MICFIWCLCLLNLRVDSFAAVAAMPRFRHVGWRNGAWRRVACVHALCGVAETRLGGAGAVVDVGKAAKWVGGELTWAIEEAWSG